MQNEKEQKVEWPERIEEWGKKFWQGQDKKSQKEKGVTNYVITILVNVALYYVFNNLLNWGVLPFLTETFTASLWILNISILVTILFNICYLFYDGNWFLHLTKTISNIIGVVFMLTLLLTFPFTFSGSTAQLAEILLTLGIIGCIIGALVEFMLSLKRS